METNPFAPPRANVASQSPAGHVSRYWGLAVAGLFAIHIGIFVHFSPVYAELLWEGALTIGGPFVGLVSDIVLLVGIVLLIVRRHSQLPFLIAAPGLLFAALVVAQATTIYALGVETWGLGAAVAAFGWWVVFRHNRSARQP